MRLHFLITLVRSSEYFRFIESLRTCIMASQDHLKFLSTKKTENSKDESFVIQENFSDKSHKSKPTQKIDHISFATMKINTTASDSDPRSEVWKSLAPDN